MVCASCHARATLDGTAQDGRWTGVTEPGTRRIDGVEWPVVVVDDDGDVYVCADATRLAGLLEGSTDEVRCVVDSQGRRCRVAFVADAVELHPRSIAYTEFTEHVASRVNPAPVVASGRDVAQVIGLLADQERPPWVRWARRLGRRSGPMEPGDTRIWKMDTAVRVAAVLAGSALAGLSVWVNLVMLDDLPSDAVLTLAIVGVVVLCGQLVQARVEVGPGKVVVRNLLRRHEIGSAEIVDVVLGEFNAQLVLRSGRKVGMLALQINNYERHRIETSRAAVAAGEIDQLLASPSSPPVAAHRVHAARPGLATLVVATVILASLLVGLAEGIDR